ncbi:MAG: ABC transporter permease [Hyphomicrobiales bacterium]|nr:ABC transporter permease [Hyphomicrobiales bacterium]
MFSQIAIDEKGARASRRRVSTMVRRYAILVLGSAPRMLELAYWPLVQMLMWGFLQTHLAGSTSLFANAAGLLIGSVLLWDVLVRGQLGFSLSFLEELWSRNLGNILMSPLRPAEYVGSLMVISLIRLLIGVLPAIFLAYIFFGFNLFSLGLPIAAFFANLVFFAWAIGLTANGLVVRYGLGAESVVWLAIFSILPFSCVYYPLSTLPAWLQPISAALPSTHVFEGLRALMLDETFEPILMVKAFALNVIYFSGAYLIFRHFLKVARIKGTLMQLGE